MTTPVTAKIVDIENVTITAAGLNVNLATQTEGFRITANSGGGTITARTGGDTIKIDAGGSTTADWTIGVGADVVQDTIILNHNALTPGDFSLVTVTDFDETDNDRGAVRLMAEPTAAAFQTITADNTNVTGTNRTSR